MRKAKFSKLLSLVLSASMLVASVPFGEGKVSAADTNTVTSEGVLLSSPANLQVTTTDHEINATWDAVEGAEQYVMTIDGNPAYKGKEPSFVTYMAPDTSYEIAVWAIDHAGTPSEKSIVIVKTKEKLIPSSPKFNVTTDETSLTVSWEEAERATSYVVRVDNKEVYRGTDLSYTLTGLIPKTSYVVDIWSENEHGTSGSQRNTVTTKDPDKLPAPKGLKVESTWNTIRLSWDPVDGANTYRVIKNNTFLYEGPNTTYTITGLDPDHPYSLYVYGLKKSPSSITIEGEQGRIMGVTKKLPEPNNFVAIPKSTSVDLSWDAVEKADNYKVLRGKLIIYEGPLTTFVDTGLNEGETYNYSVLAMDDFTSGLPAYTSVKTLIPPQLPYPENFRVTELQYNKIRIDWDAVDGADEYEISRDGMTIGIPMGTWWTEDLEDIWSGATYTYRVAALRKGVKGKVAMKVVTIPNEPVQGQAPSGDLALKANRVYHDRVGLSWATVTGATYYDVLQDDTNKVWTGSINSMTVGNVGPEESHTYKVVAGNADGTLESNVIEVTTPAAPQPIVITPSQPMEGTITFNFNAIEGAVTYVERNPQTTYTPLGDGTYRKTFVNSATGESRDDGIVSPVNGKLNFSETDVYPNRTYNYEIVAVVKNADGTESVVAKEEISVTAPADGGGATVPGTIVDPGTGTPTNPGTGNGGGTTPTTPATPGTGGAVTNPPSGGSTPSGTNANVGIEVNGTVTVPGPQGDNDVEVIPEEETEPKTYSDIDGSYAKEAILSLTSKGIVKGYADGTFGVKKQVTRAEFAIILNRAMGYTSSSPYAGTFKDIDPEAWYVSELNSAIEHKITKGFDDNTYRPNEVISREQAASMLSNVLLRNGSSLSSAGHYKDQANIATWAKESVELVTQESVMSGYPGNKFMPKRSLSREEAAQMIYNLIRITS
ncbi:S-layer homology domain-containing protein [Paenibacillus sp. 2KB_22]|uniref:S-layer homology domain-containing protein n=1 Tax=Paenibacillus sp. 2KB_22 TaxID=3232978 RepID=UPI003F9C9BEA